MDKGRRGVSEKLLSYLKEKKEFIDRWMRENLPPVEPKSLREAVNYALFPGGKRIRPILCLSVCDILGEDPETVAPAACAIELIHTYSLIHDDLPCMDDDDFRRGKPTVHRMFGEALAVLAGDALLTMAFEILTDPSRYKDPSLPRILLVTNEIAKAAGGRGMVAGQVADIEAEGIEQGSLEQLEFIHENKTAKMIEVSLKAGAILCGAGYREIEKLSEYGRFIGHAFQITDDILGEVGTEDKLGKPVKKDSERGKLTACRVLGVDGAREKARALVEKAKKALSIFDKDRCWMLYELADFILEREH